MANYECHSRTSYFRPTDPEKLKELVRKIPGAELFENEDMPGEYAFGAEGPLGDYDEGEDVLSTFEALSQLLPEEESVIVLEAGHEKLRYVSCLAWVITKDNVDFMNLSSMAVDKAREYDGRRKFKLEY